MNQPMNLKVERRRSEPAPEERLSPEALALLASCGGDIRRSDWALIAKASAGDPPERRSRERRGEDRRSQERRRPGSASGPE
mgnify:FL=1